MPRRSNNKKKEGKKKKSIGYDLSSDFSAVEAANEYISSNPAKFLVFCLKTCKTQRDDANLNLRLFQQISRISKESPAAFASSLDGFDLSTEIPLAVLVAMKSHPLNEEIQLMGYITLCCLFCTPCHDNLIKKFQLHKSILLMENPFPHHNKSGFQYASLLALKIIAESHAAVLENSSFGAKVPSAVVTALKAHPENEVVQKAGRHAIRALLLTRCCDLIQTFVGIHDSFIQCIILDVLVKIFTPTESYTVLRDIKSGLLVYSDLNKKCQWDGFYKCAKFMGTQQARQVLFEVCCDKVLGTMTEWKENIEIQKRGWEALRSMGISQLDGSFYLLGQALYTSMLELNQWSIEQLSAPATTESNLQCEIFPTGCLRFLEVFNSFFADTIQEQEAYEIGYLDFEGINLLSNLMWLSQSDNEDAKVWLTTQGGASFLLALMAEDPGDQEMRQYVAKIFGFLTTSHNPKILEAISELDGVDVLLDAIEKYPKDEIIFHYGGSAALRVREYEDAKEGFIWKNIYNA